MIQGNAIDDGLTQDLSGLTTYSLCSKARLVNKGQTGKKLFSCEFLNIDP